MAERRPSTARRDGAPPDLRAEVLVIDGVRYAVLSHALPAGEGRAALTPTELELVDLLIEGLSDREIATRRGRSRSTITKQIASVYRKLGVRSRRELIAQLG